MGPATLPTRALGFRTTVVRAPVITLHATGLRRLALGRHAAATRADTAAHRILYPTDAIDPFVEEASAPGVARAADPITPGETRGNVLRAGAGAGKQPWAP